MTGFARLALVAMMVGCGGGGSSTDGDGKAGKGKSDRVVLQNKGSDTLVNVAQAWAEAYKTVEPNVAIAVSGGGSGTGIAALMNGTVDLANSSRKIKDKELKRAKENGVEAVEHTVGHDALAVYLHDDNPISEITIRQLQAIYGEGGTAEKWSDLGVTVPGCSSDEIVRVSRQNNSGTYAYFRLAVLGKKGEYKLGSRDLHGSKDVVDLVEKTPCAIGYSGLAYATEHIKMPCVKKDDAAECVLPSPDNAIKGTYPIARPLLMYTNGQPEGAVKSYLDWILGDKGQCIIANKGYAPVRDLSCGAE
jgi:phosphate transport system substrate-binding protein